MKKKGIICVIFSFIQCLLFCAILLGQSDSQKESAYLPGQITVWFKDETPEATQNGIVQNLQPEQHRKRYTPGLHTLVFGPAANLNAIVEGLSHNPNVRVASRAPRVDLSAQPNDLHWRQWGLYKNSVPNVDIDAKEAWDITTGSSSVKVALIDTGVGAWNGPQNPDLVDNLIAGRNFAHNPDDGDTRDMEGHGTRVAGIIGARGNNNQGITGVNWQVSIMPMVFDKGEPASLIDCITWARAHGAHIFNLSLSLKAHYQPLNDAMAVYPDDDLFVFAVGNAYGLNAQGIDIDVDPADPEDPPGVDCVWSQAGYPCRSNVRNHPTNVLCVAASNPEGRVARFSNFGVRDVDIAAPGGVDHNPPTGSGEGIYTTQLYSVPSFYDYSRVDETLCGQDGFIPHGSGTSYAAPFVTGIAALVKAANPSLYPGFQIRDAIVMGSTPVSVSGVNTFYRKVQFEGLANARAALNVRFADTFDRQIVDGSLFFDWGGEWVVAQNGCSRCDVRTSSDTTYVNGVRRVTTDRTVKAEFLKRAGDPGSKWTLASYRGDYPPGASPQTYTLWIAPVNEGSVESDLASGSGRVGVGAIGQTSAPIWSACAEADNHWYDRITFSGSMMGGIELNSGVPFVYFDSPYVEYTFPAISLAGVRKLSIALQRLPSSVRLVITNRDTGQELANITQGFLGWGGLTGPEQPALMYYGTQPGVDSGSLHFRAFASTM